MLCARPLVVVMGLGVVLAACGESVAWRVRAPVPQPPTRVIGGVPVATLCEDLPNLTEADVAYLVGQAEKELEGVRVRRIVHSRMHPGEIRYVKLQFEYHETHARIRRSGSIEIAWDENEEGGVGRGAWSWHTEQESIVDAEICAPGRSFLDHEPVPDADVVHVGVSGDLTADEIVDVVDAVYDHVPAGQKLAFISREDGAFEVMTVRARKYRSYSGSALEVRRGLRGWKVTLTGEWVS